MLKLGRFAFLFVAVLCAAGCLLFGGVGLLAIHDDAANASRLLHFALPCLIGLALSIAGYVWLGKRLQARQQALCEEARRLGELEASGSPWVPLLLLFVVLICAACAFSGWNKHAWFFFGASAAIGALMLFGLLEYLRQIARPGPMLRLDSQGIDHAQFGLVRWPNIIGLHLSAVALRGTTQYTLCAGVRDPLRNVTELPLFQRRLRRKWERDRAAYGSVRIPLNALNRDAQLIFDTALALRRKHAAPLLEHWYPDMDAHGIDAQLQQQDIHRELQRVGTDLRAQPAAGTRLHELMARQQALRPQLDAVHEKTMQRAKKAKRTSHILLAAMLLLFAVRVWASWHKYHH